MQKQQLIGYKLDEVKSLLDGYGQNPMLAKEICLWMYRRRCKSFLEMESIPLDIRRKLDSNFSIEPIHPVSNQESIDGTIKYLFKTQQSNPYETAYIPGGARRTLCISTQSGCRMGCSFCYTGNLGLKENLSAAQILGQLIAIPNGKQVNRIVLMGMGEPLDNPVSVFRVLEILNAQWGFAFGATNITLSTVGIIPQLDGLVKSRYCNIAISLHSPFPEQRVEIVPSEKDYPIPSIVKYFKQNLLIKPLRLSFEYVVIPGENDSMEYANGVAELLADLRCHVNVIPLNSQKSDSQFLSAARKFQQGLILLGIPATLRISRGQDIDAACGMMAGKLT